MSATDEQIADLASLQDFCDRVLKGWPEYGGVDGFELQDIAEACGLLKAETRIIPCGENCNCTGYGNDGEETQCYRIQPAMSRAREAAAKRAALQAKPPEGAT